jgi:hypothetical protein
MIAVARYWRAILVNGKGYGLLFVGLAGGLEGVMRLG